MSVAQAHARNRRWLLIGVAAAAAIAAAAAWLVLRGPLVNAFELHAAPLRRTLQFSARVASLSRVDVGSTLTGRVARVLVAEGAQVRQGEVLIELEPDELRAAVTQAVASEQQAQARLAGLRSTGRAAAQAGLAQADATLKAAEAELVRSRQLVARGFLSAARLDEVRRSADVARAQQAAARAQARASDDAGTEVAQARAQLAQARAQLALARARLAQAALLAPSAARVLTRQVEPGQIVQPGKALLNLALSGPTLLTAQVDERFLGQLQPGQTAAVLADAFATRRFSASVLSIAPAVDAQRGAIEVKFALEQPAPAFLREDMTLSVEVETGRRERALVLPLSALRTQAADSSATLLVAQNGRARQHSVRLGLRTLDAAEVLDGLSEGQAVLLGGSLQAGDRVRIRLIAWQPGQPVTGSGGTLDAGSALTNAMGR